MVHSNKQKIVFCLLGPTASGKTKLAVELAQIFPLDLISVDSAMVYRGMDIGTAKPSPAELARAPHRLIDICDPAESYSAGQFCLDAQTEIEKIHQDDRIPLLVGGTMLYFNLFQRGFSHFPSTEPEIRERINQRAKERGWPALYQQLSVIDPGAAKQIHPNDPQRIQRALELYEMTGKTVTELQAEQTWEKNPYKVINILLCPPERAVLHQRIATRVDEMLEQGLIAEVEALYQRGDLTALMPSMRMINYRQVWSYLEGDYDKKELRDRAIFATRQFAKRQCTWLKRWQGDAIFNSEEAEIVANVTSRLLQYMKTC